MAQRTVALYNGKYIGIESIFTVIDGKQINIPDKLKELRKKSQSNELFCPCGCGSNLILVAGDKNLREQHFRIKEGQCFDNCTVITEGKTSVDSKIVLKCWLDDNLHAEDLESRVQICDIADSDRRYEFTFISRDYGIAIDYCHNRANLSDEKQTVLEENSKDIRIIHIVDYMNGGAEGQYPEGLMKVQSKQGFCLLLSVVDADYETAEMRAAFYDRNIDGLWQEEVFTEGLLKEYRIDDRGNLFFRNKTLISLLEGAKQRFHNHIVIERQRREDDRRRRDALIKKQQEERERWLEEQCKRREEFAKKQRIQKEEAEKARAEQEERKRIEDEKILEEKRRLEEDFKKNLESGLEQQETPVRDSEGNRWIRCEFCGKIAKDSEFSSYGGAGHVNLGTCKECSDNNPAVKQAIEREIRITRMKYDFTVCPECGGKLVEKNGRNGRFIGCSSFPRCRYTRSIKK